MQKIHPHQFLNRHLLKKILPLGETESLNVFGQYHQKKKITLLDTFCCSFLSRIFCICSDSAVQCSAVQCSAVQWGALQCNAMQCCTVWCSAVQKSEVQCRKVHCNAVHCRAVQCSAVQCSAVQCIALQCSVMRFIKMQCRSVQQGHLCLNKCFKMGKLGKG